MLRRRYITPGVLALALLAAGACGDDFEGDGSSAGETATSGSGGSSSGSGGTSNGEGGASDPGAAGAPSHDGGEGGMAGGPPDAAEGGSGDGGATTCDEDELLEALPDVFEAALDSTPCLTGNHLENQIGALDYCEASPCECEAAIGWIVTLDGPTLTAIGTVTATIPANYYVGEVGASCTASFSAYLVYSTTIGVSSEGGLHTTATTGNWSYQDETIPSCGLLQADARELFATDVAQDLLNTVSALDEAAVVASNACP